MADEWSKPVKGDGDTWRVTLDNGYSDGSIVIFSDGEITAEREATGDDGGTVYAAVHTTRDVVLRLLAAEASDRLGWVWEVGKNDAGHLRARCYPDASKEPASDWGAWSAWGPRGEATFQIAYWNAELTGDALIALAHGRFLLADALREAGQ